MSFKEEWKIVENVVNKSGHTYSVSNTGRVINNMTGRELSLRPDGGGYPRANMNNKEYKMHRLVASHFIENPNPEKYNVINHIDGNKKNNLYTNLEWCDQSYNVRHALSIGLIPSATGELNANSILKEEDVLLIWSTDMPVKEIAKKYGLTEGTSVMIRNKTLWQHLKPKFYELYGKELEIKHKRKRKEEWVRNKTKLTEVEIKEIYDLSHSDVQVIKIKEKYNISDQTYYSIKNKKSAISQLVLDGYIHDK